DYQKFSIDEDLKKKVLARAESELENILENTEGKAAQYEAIDQLRDTIVAELAGDDAALAGQVKEAYTSAEKAVVRRRIINDGKRPDGRKPTEIRPIWAE